MPRVTVVNVRGLTGRAREGIVYVGRANLTWYNSAWRNPYRVGGGTTLAAALELFRGHMARQSPLWLENLWELTGRGAKPLGCWCYAGEAQGGLTVCHAAVLAHALNQRFVDPTEGVRPCAS